MIGHLVPSSGRYLIHSCLQSVQEFWKVFKIRLQNPSASGYFVFEKLKVWEQQWANTSLNQRKMERKFNVVALIPHCKILKNTFFKIINHMWCGPAHTKMEGGRLHFLYYLGFCNCYAQDLCCIWDRGRNILFGLFFNLLNVTCFCRSTHIFVPPVLWAAVGVF
jgi:hypothetical protein